MKPVDQTTFGVPKGNCFSACVATLLGLTIEQVPFFMGDPDEPGHVWWDRFNGWLEARGLYALNFNVRDQETDASLPGFYILCGDSPAGPHSCVARGRAHPSSVVHDPNPSRAGLLKVDSIVVLVPLDPERAPS